MQSRKPIWDVSRSVDGEMLSSLVDEIGWGSNGCTGVEGAVDSSCGADLERVENIRFIRDFVVLSKCSLRTCIFNSAMELRVDVPNRLRVFVSTFPNTLKRRSHVAELAETKRR